MISNKLSAAALVVSVMSTNFAVAGQELQPGGEKTYEEYQVEARDLSSSEIFEEINRTSDIIRLKESRHPGYALISPESIKGSGYASVLEERKNLGDPAASLFYGIYNARICSGMEAYGSADMPRAVDKCWASSLESFKVSSAAGVSSATRNVGLMYEDGKGVTKSLYAAAEWYVRSAEQFVADGDRDEALISLEAAVRVMPNHPAVIRLKNSLIK